MLQTKPVYNVVVKLQGGETFICTMLTLPTVAALIVILSETGASEDFGKVLTVAGDINVAESGPARTEVRVGEIELAVITVERETAYVVETKKPRKPRSDRGKTRKTADENPPVEPAVA